MSEKNIYHNDYFDILMRQFSPKFIDSIDPKRRTDRPEKIRLERIRNFYSFVVPSIITKCLKGRYFCLFPDCDSGQGFIHEIYLIRHICLEHKKDIPRGGSFLLDSNFSLNYNIICEQCIDVENKKDITILLSETSLDDIEVPLGNQQLSIMYTDEWHILTDSFFSNSASTGTNNSSTDDDEDSWFLGSIKTLKRDITTESFLDMRKRFK